MHKISSGFRGCIVAMVICSLMPGLVVLGQDAPIQRVYPIGELKQAAAIREAVWRADPQAKTTFDRAQRRVVVEGSAAAQDAASAAVQGDSHSAGSPQTLNSPDARPIEDASNQPELRTMAVPAQHLQPISTAVGLRYRNTPGVQISPDRQKGQLLIMAPRELQDQIVTDVESLLPAHGSGPGRNTQNMNHSRQPLRVALRRIGWQQFEDTLKEFVGERLPVTTSRNGELATFQLVGHPLQGTTVEVDRRENAVTVVAPQPAIPGWQQMITSLDQSTRVPGEVMDLIRVQNAEPAPIQRAIRLLGNFRADDTTAVAKAPQQGGADARLQGIAFQQPQAQPPADDDVDSPVQGVVPVIEENGGGGLIGDTQIQFVPELGVIIVKGSKRDVARVMEVIEQIEAQSAVTQPKVDVYQLKHVNSQAIADLLDELYSEVLSARQGAVSITSLDKPNALLLIGREEALNNVRDLIEELDQPVAPSTQLRVFRLEHGSALDAEETVRSFFTDQPGEDDLRPALGTRARVIADYRTNSLIVQASPRDLLEVAKLIEELDVQDVPSKSELKVIKLRNALAEDLAPVLQDAIHGETETTNEDFTQPSRTLSILSVDAEGNRLLDSGILAGAVITADANSNALIVRASSSSIPLIEELIRQLDQPPGAESLVKVFTVENGDAVRLTEALQNLFGTAGATGGGAGVGTQNLAGLSPTTAGDSSLVSLRFSTDQRTNSVIATGSASDLEVVESLLLRLDTSGFAERVFEVIWLRNQFAPDVAAALQQFVQNRFQQSQQIQQFQQGLGPYDALERDLVVVAEPTSNSLVISVAPRLYDTVRRIIDQLDRRAPMIMVKVLIAEVELTDGIEVGAEFGVQDSLLFDRGVAGTASTPGFNFNNAGLPNENTAGSSTLAEQAVTAFGLGRTSQNFGYGGFVLSAASDSVSLLLRTLQNAGRLQILSRPQLMTLDNTEGLVQVGALVPRVTSVTQGGLGVGPTIATADVEVGLILRVTPRVGRDGLIVMNVDATRSAVGDISQGIPVGFGPDGEVILSPQIEQTTAQSVITAFSGQTVVYGGLIQKQRSQTIRRVPLVSDIPILGRLFRYDQESERRSELLVVLTPMIVSGGEDLEYLKATESSKMSWCLPEVVEMHGDVGLNGGHGLWGPALPPVIYPDMQPTVDDFEMMPPYEVVPPGADHEIPHGSQPDGVPPAFSDEVPPAAFPSEGNPAPAEQGAPPAKNTAPPTGAVQESVLETARKSGRQPAPIQPAGYNGVPPQAAGTAGEMALPAEWQNRMRQADNPAVGMQR